MTEPVDQPEIGSNVDQVESRRTELQQLKDMVERIKSGEVSEEERQPLIDKIRTLHETMRQEKDLDEAEAAELLSVILAENEEEEDKEDEGKKVDTDPDAKVPDAKAPDAPKVVPASKTKMEAFAEKIGGVAQNVGAGVITFAETLKNTAINMGYSGMKTLLWLSEIIKWDWAIKFLRENIEPHEIHAMMRAKLEPPKIDPTPEDVGFVSQLRAQYESKLAAKPSLTAATYSFQTFYNEKIDQLKLESKENPPTSYKIADLLNTKQDLQEQNEKLTAAQTHLKEAGAYQPDPKIDEWILRGTFAADIDAIRFIHVPGKGWQWKWNQEEARGRILTEADGADDAQKAERRRANILADQLGIKDATPAAGESAPEAIEVKNKRILTALINAFDNAAEKKATIFNPGDSAATLAKAFCNALALGEYDTSVMQLEFQGDTLESTDTGLIGDLDLIPNWGVTLRTNPELALTQLMKFDVVNFHTWGLGARSSRNLLQIQNELRRTIPDFANKN